MGEGKGAGSIRNVKGQVDDFISQALPQCVSRARNAECRSGLLSGDVTYPTWSGARNRPEHEYSALQRFFTDYYYRPI